MTRLAQSALYPNLESDATSERWLSTLESVFTEVHQQGWDEPANLVTPSVQDLVDRLRSSALETWEVPERQLADLLSQHRPEIARLSVMFGLEPGLLLAALGRGWLPGGPGLDQEVAGIWPGLPRLRGLVSSGSAAVERGGLRTVLIAATDIRGEFGPTRLDGATRWENADVWLCSVSPRSDFTIVVRDLLERCLPHAGVNLFELAIHRHPATVRARLQEIDSDIDPELVLVRLDGWRTALSALTRNNVNVVWNSS
ncbi:MAG: hypothetical protein ACRDNF_06045 [Streptosporangiaceae bacterium]